MKKIFKYIFLINIFIIFFAINKNVVNAEELTTESFEYKDKETISFDYLYIENDIYKNDEIRIDFNECKGSLFSKCNDKLVINVYDERFNYDLVIKEFDNESGTYILSETGKYKLNYIVNDKTIKTYDLEVIDGIIDFTMNDNYEDEEIYNEFIFYVNLKTTKDINDLHFYYSFDSLNYKEFSITDFSNIHELINKEIKIKIDEEINDYLYLKVEGNNLSRVIKSEKKYLLTNKIKAKINVDNNHYLYKNDEIVKLNIEFNAFVSFSDTNIKINDKNYLVEGKNNVKSFTINYLINNYKMDSYLLMDLSNLLVNNGERVEFDCSEINKVFIDITSPIIDGYVVNNDGNYHSDYEIKLYFSDYSGIDKVYYYFSEYEKNFNTAKTIEMDNSQEELSLNIEGKYNESNVTLYLMVVDNAGNKTITSKSNLLVDNVIVEDSSILFSEKETKENYKLINKEFYLNLKEEYKIDHFMITSSDNQVIQYVEGNNLNKTIKLFSIDYNFNDDFTFELVDKLGNKETYVYTVSFNNLEDISYNYDNYVIESYSNKEYGLSISINNNDYLNRIELDSDLINYLKNQLHLPSNLENLTMSNLIESSNSLFSNTKKECAFVGNYCDNQYYINFKYYINFNGVRVNQNKKVLVVIKDLTNKMIVNGFVKEITKKLNEYFDDFTYSYFDNINNNLSIKDITRKITINGEEVSEIVLNKVGKYEVEESFVYNGNNSFPINYVINVVDDEAPIIKLNSSVVKVQNGDDSFDILSNVEALDNYDSDLKIEYSVDKTFDVNSNGEYVVSYWTVDNSGNISEVQTMTIIVNNNKKVITYLIYALVITFCVSLIVIAIKYEKKRMNKYSSY